MLIVTGISPVTVPQLEEMGVTVEPLRLLLTMSGKDTFRFSIPTIAPAVIGSYLRGQGIVVEISDFYFDEVDSSSADIVGI